MNRTWMSPQGESDFPVIKIGLDFTVLDCNVSALPLLNHWRCKINNRIPDTVMEQYPVILSSLQQNDESGMHVVFRDFIIRFTVVPFPEAGYIGLYGYQVEKAGRHVNSFTNTN